MKKEAMAMRGRLSVTEERPPLREFIAFPLRLYRDDPNYVPQLARDVRAHCSSKNPFFEEGEAAYFLARRGDTVVGRIAAVVNRAHNAYHRDRTGFFGFFDCVEDQEAANALFAACAGFLRARGLESMRGPLSFSTNDECGMLLEGYDEPPMIMMPYNAPYYHALCAGAGLAKVKDLYAYIYHVQEALPEKVLRVARLIEQRGVTVRPINMKRFAQDMLVFREVYNSAWASNWGFVPMSERELVWAAAQLKQVIVPELTVIAEHEGLPVGFMGIVPDANFVLRRMHGSLNPVSLAKALWYSRRIPDLRVLLLGVKQSHRNRGIEALMFRAAFPQVRKGGFRRVEFSWILEDNIPVQRTIETGNGTLYKRYRIYEKGI